MEKEVFNFLADLYGEETTLHAFSLAERMEKSVALRTMVRDAAKRGRAAAEAAWFIHKLREERGA